MRSSLLSLCVALPFFAGCVAGEKAPISEDFSDLANLDEKSDAFSYRMKSLGGLDYGQTSATVRYTSSPRFRSYKFAGGKGDKIDVRVRSTDGGDAVAWLLDNAFNVVADNDDAAEGGLDSHIQATLPGNTNPSIKSYYIVYRDYDLQAHRFNVTLNAEVAPAADFFACNTDTDCVAVPRHMCCPDCSLEAVNKDQKDAYASVPLVCPAVLCPLACRLDQRVAQCNRGTNQCEMVEIGAISCGGFIANPHHCPTGYDCQLNSGHPDTGGQCVLSDCRATGCAAGHGCQFCWGSFACVPDGAVC